MFEINCKCKCTRGDIIIMDNNRSCGNHFCLTGHHTPPRLPLDEVIFIFLISIPLLLLCLLLHLSVPFSRKKRASRKAYGQGGRPDTVEEVRQRKPFITNPSLLLRHTGDIPWVSRRFLAGQQKTERYRYNCRQLRKITNWAFNKETQNLCSVNRPKNTLKFGNQEEPRTWQK